MKSCKPEGFSLLRACRGSRAGGWLWEGIVFIVPALFPCGHCEGHTRLSVLPDLLPHQPSVFGFYPNSLEVRCCHALLDCCSWGSDGYQGRWMVEGDRTSMADAGILGPFPRRFRPHSLTCLRAENKVAKEIKAWCGETKHEAYWLLKNILNNILWGFILYQKQL